jgi:hypothetical protein
MKYLYLLIGIIFIGCNSKSIIEKPKKAIIETKKVVIKKKPIIIVEEEVVVEEPKVTKDIKPDIPPSCAMWSDGCNVCTRISNRKASCTTYPACHNRLVSCLKWN